MGGRALPAWMAAWVVAALLLMATATGSAAALASPPVAVAEDIPAAYVGASGETILLLPDGTTRVLGPYPGGMGDGARVALDPPGTTLATARTVADGRDVILVSLADGGVRTVPGTRERRCADPTFHPDGVHLLAVCDASRDPYKRSIDLFHREHGYVRRLVQGGQRGIQFVLAGAEVSPDGSWALVREALGDYAVRHWRLDLATGRIDRLALPEPAQAIHLEGFLADGRILGTRCEACAVLGPAGPAALQAEVVTLAPDGSLDPALHASAVPIYGPALSPDGDTLLYSTVAADGMQLWRLVRSTGALTLVGNGSGAVYPRPSTSGGPGRP